MADRTVRYVFTGSFTNLTAGLTAAGRNVSELGTKMTALDKNGAKMRAGLTTLGSAAGKVGLVAAGGLALAVGAAARFDKAMSAVQAATHETAANMDELRAAAIKAGADTVYSASEAAGAIEELAKAGVSTKDILAGGLSGSLNLAAAGAIDVADAAELAATAMTQFKLGGDQVNHVADLLAAGAGKAQGSVDDLGMALKQSGLVAAQTGLSIEETTGTLAAFASAGLIGSDAGTSFKTMLQSLTPTGEKARAKMEELGITAYDAQGNFVGMTEFAGRLRAGLADLSTEQQNAALKTIFGSDAVRAASVIYQQGADGIQGWIDKTNDAGYAAETAATRMDNLAGDLEQLKGSLETALIGAGEGSQGPLRSLVQGMTQAVNALSSVPGPAKNAATALLAVTAVAGGGLWFGAKVVEGITKMKVALNSLGIEAATTRDKLALVGAGGAAAALGIGTFIDTISQMDSWKRSQAAADATTKSYQDLADALSYSNVGKYADDLHINLGRLAQDLYENGTSGEYAKSVIDDLADASHGFGALVKAETGHIIPGWTSATEKATDAHIDLREILKNNSDTLGKSTLATDAATQADEALAEQQGYASVAAMKAADAQKDLAAALAKQRDEARATAKSFIGLGDSLDDSKKSLTQWLKELEQQNEALRNFTKNAQTAAKRGLDDGLIQSLNEAGPAGALRMKQLANATDAELARANKAWRQGQAAIRDYVNMAVPEKKVKVDNGPAMSAIAKLKAALANIRDEDVNVRVHYLNIGNKMAGMAAGRSAEGGTIPGSRQPYGDKMLYMLAPGEEVISNRRGQADRFRPLLKQINNAADGATVGGYARVGAGGTPAFEQLVGGVSLAADALAGLGKLGEKELRRRASLLDRQENLAQKALDQAKERLDEERQALRELRDARKEFAASVTANFRSDAFGGTDLEQAARQGLLGGDFMQGLLTWLRDNKVEIQAGTMVSDYAGQYLATLTPQQIAALQAQASIGTLQQNSQDAQAFEQVLQQLRDMGLTGGAFNEVAASGNLSQAQAYLAMGPDFIKTLVQDFRQRDQDLKNLGQYVGNARFGADIRDQLKETRRATRVAEEARNSLRTIERAQHDIAARLDRIEKNSPKATGAAVGQAISGAVTHGQQRGR